MNRGSKNKAKRDSRPSTSFNEAPIHESGKSRTAGRADPRRTGFNEAPIHESGK